MSAAIRTLHRSEAVPPPHGQHLGVLHSARFAALPQFAAVAQVLEGEGYALRSLTTPIWRPDGTVVVRLVWRRRADGSCVVVHEPLRDELPVSLLDALLRGTQPDA